MEMRLLCEILHERLRCRDTPAEPGLPIPAIECVLKLYMDMQQELVHASNAVHSTRCAAVRIYKR